MLPTDLDPYITGHCKRNSQGEQRYLKVLSQFAFAIKVGSIGSTER